MIDYHIILGAISGLLAVVAIVPYIKDILHGSTRPNIISWSLWVGILLISILAQISAGASWSLVFLVGDLVGTGIVVILCLAGYGYSEYGWIEGGCLTLAIIAIASWQLTSNPLLAIIFSIVADLMASIPTVVKAYRDPRSEHPTQFILISIASVLGIISTTIINSANILFPAYLFLINGMIGTLALVGRHSKQKTNII